MARSTLLAIALALGGAGLLVATGAADPIASRQPPPLGAAVAPDGTVLAVACGDGRTVIVHGAPPDAQAWVREVLLPDLPADARIADVKVAPYLWTAEHRGLALGLVVRRDGKQEVEYRYAVQSVRADAPWVTSEPIFEDRGAPWRIAEIRQAVADGDTIEILFTRGFNSPRTGRADGAFEVRQYTDVCPDVARAAIRGKSSLVSLAPTR